MCTHLIYSFAGLYDENRIGSLDPDLDFELGGDCETLEGKDDPICGRVGMLIAHMHLSIQHFC
jgi:hypothetical protein